MRQCTTVNRAYCSLYLQHPIKLTCLCCYLFTPQVAPALLQRLFYLLEHHAALFPADEVAHTDLTVWALLTLRYVGHLDDRRPNASTTSERAESNAAQEIAVESVAYAYYTRLFKILCEVADPVVQMRMFAEFSVLVVHHAIEGDFQGIEVPAAEEWSKHGTSRTGYRFTATLPASLLRSTAVRTLLEAGVRTAQAPVLARFITALSATYASALQYTLTPVLLLLPAIHASSSNSSSTNATTAPAVEVDLFNFAPTIEAPPTSTSSSGSEGEQRSALLDAYLTGREENLHSWALLRDDVGCARIRRLCTDIHAILRQSTSSPASSAAAVIETVKKEFQQLVWILAALLEGAVFTIKTFEKYVRCLYFELSGLLRTSPCFACHLGCCC